MLAAKAAQPLFLQQAAPNFTVFMVIVFGPVVCCLILLLWWLFFTRAPWSDRLIGLAGAVVGSLVAWYVADPSIHGQASIFYVLPDAALAFTVAFLILSRWGVRLGTVTALVAGALALGYWDTVRFDGMWGNFKATIHWRWEKTSEQTFLAERNATARARARPQTPSRWGKSCGRSFAGRSATAWRRASCSTSTGRPTLRSKSGSDKVGPGWSSFSVAGNRLFTQEQRGENEDVVCYDAKTGEERWINETKARFDEAMGGAGPRATPTLAGGLLYVQGAAGLLQCLDPLTGAVKWKRDLMQEANRKKTPIWGYSSSPLIVGDKVIAYSSGDEGEKGMLLAFDAATGEPRWTATAGNSSYSSPQLAKLAGREVVLFWGQTGLTAVDAPTGKPAWNYDWLFQGYRVVQPLLLSETSVLLGTGWVKARGGSSWSRPRAPAK